MLQRTAPQLRPIAVGEFGRIYRASQDTRMLGRCKGLPGLHGAESLGSGKGGTANTSVPLDEKNCILGMEHLGRADKADPPRRVVSPRPQSAPFSMYGVVCPSGTSDSRKSSAYAVKETCRAPQGAEYANLPAIR